MTISQKHRDLVAEPMGEKPAGSLAGTGEVLGEKLEERGFDKACAVPGQLLVLKKDEDLFREWLKDTCGASAKQSRDGLGGLRERRDAFWRCSPGSCQSPALIRSLQPSRDASPVRYKGKDCYCRTHLRLP
nr:barrier-to-autointegration factor-like [Saimiri boliviensis boliviensis]